MGPTMFSKAKSELAATTCIAALSEKIRTTAARGLPVDELIISAYDPTDLPCSGAATDDEFPTVRGVSEDDYSEDFDESCHDQETLI